MTSFTLAVPDVDHHRRPRLPSARLPWGILLAVAVATAVIASGMRVPFVVPVIGFWLIVVLPVQLLYAKLQWPGANAPERLVYAVATTLLLVMATALILNTVLPLLGAEHPPGTDRPLVRRNVLVVTDLFVLALLAWRPDRWRWRATAGPRLRDVVRWRDCVVVGGTCALVVLAVAGPTRLNNGAGGGFSLAALVVATAVLVLLLLWRHDLHPGTIAVAVYLVSLALLLLTSLRGWYITGHDSQREFGMFQFTVLYDRWSIRSFHNSYNACLSITLLPTVLSRITGVADPYVFKVLFQVLFALCPLLVYLIARRFASIGTALLAAIYFIALPTYLSDMPFLNRQEIAFLFLGAATLVVTNPALTVGGRRVWFGIFSTGIVLSHYSTAYVLIGVLVFAYAARAVTAAMGKVLPGRLAQLRESSPVFRRSRDERPVIGIANVLLLVVVASMWSGPVTHTGGQFQQTLAATVRDLSSGQGSKSSDVSYNLLSARQKPDPQHSLTQYADEALTLTAGGRAQGAYPPLAQLERYRTPLIEEPELPLTAAGRTLETIGLDVSSFNSVIRQGMAKLLQVFLAIGLIAVAFGHRRRVVSTPEFFFLAMGSFAVVLLLVLLPQLSQDYGVLRAFQQAMIIMAPFLALGSVLILRGLGSKAAPGASIIAVAFFVSLTGTLPQLLGNYAPQLHLNNAGQYYDNYYLHPQERIAIPWLAKQIGSSDSANLQSLVQTDRLLFSQVRPFFGVIPENSSYPTLIRNGSYVFMGYTNALKQEGIIWHQHDTVISYRYPFGFLSATKDMIYNNGGAIIYR